MVRVEIRRVVEEGVNVEVVADVIEGHEADDRATEQVDGIDASHGRMVSSSL